MILSKKASLLAVLGLMAPAVAFAETTDTRDVVRDARNHVVKNTFGHCVRTKWNAGVDKCDGKTTVLELSREARTVYFDFNKSTLKPSERTKLDQLAAAVKKSKQVESVDIIGYADRIGQSAYNQKLSQKRAQTVRSYLASKGLKTRKVRMEALGETKSVTNCAELPRAELITCLAEDRRVEVQLNLAQEVQKSVVAPAPKKAVKNKAKAKAKAKPPAAVN